MAASVRRGSMLPALSLVLLSMVGTSRTGCVSCEPPPPTDHSILYDSFHDGDLNPGIWAVHGDSVSVADGMLRILSPEPWGAGVESVEPFFSPRENDYLTIDGRVYFPPDTLRSTTLVHVQDHWREDDPDCYFLEFARNRATWDDNEASFGVRIDGVVVERVSLGSFDNGASLAWSLTLHPGRCDVQVGARSHSTGTEVHDLGLSLHGSGSATFWEYVDVTLWDVH